MPSNTSPPRTRKKSQPEAMEKSWYYSRNYTTDDLFCLFEAAKLIDFTALPVFKYNEQVSDHEKNFMLTSLLIKRYLKNHKQPSDPTLETIIHDEEQKQFYMDSRISISIDKANIPFAIADLIKRGFSNWDPFHNDANEVLTGAHGNLKVKLEILQNFITTHLMPSFNKDDMTFLLSSAHEFKHPELFHDIETTLQEFIRDLTVGGNFEKAKVIHDYIAVCKKILYQISSDQSEREKMARVLSSSLVDGLKLGFERTPFNGMFIGAVLSLAMRSSLFDSEYDPDVYTIMYKLNQACADYPMSAGVLGLRGIPVLTIPHHFSPLRKNHVDYYKQITAQFFEAQPEDVITHRNNVVTNYFVNLVCTHCQVDELEKAANIHNVIYFLGKLYREDEKIGLSKDLKYAKVLRNLLHIPSVNEKVDSLFDEIVSGALLNSSHFKHHFSEKHYLKNITRTMNTVFYQHLQDHLNVAIQEVTDMRNKLAEMEEVVALKTNANKYLEDKVTVKKYEAKLAKLKLKEQLGRLSSDDRAKMETIEHALDNRKHEKQLVKHEQQEKYKQRQQSTTKLEIPFGELRIEDEVSVSPSTKHRGILHIFRGSKEKSPTLERKVKYAPTQVDGNSPPKQSHFKRTQSEGLLKKKH